MIDWLRRNAATLLVAAIPVGLPLWCAMLDTRGTQAEEQIKLRGIHEIQQEIVDLKKQTSDEAQRERAEWVRLVQKYCLPGPDQNANLCAAASDHLTVQDGAP